MEAQVSNELSDSGKDLIRADRDRNYGDNSVDDGGSSHINGFHSTDKHNSKDMTRGNKRDESKLRQRNIESSAGRQSVKHVLPSNTTDSYERFRPKVAGPPFSSGSMEPKHVYISPRISLRSKHIIRDSRDEESLPTAQRTKLEVCIIILYLYIIL